MDLHYAIYLSSAYGKRRIPKLALNYDVTHWVRIESNYLVGVHLGLPYSLRNLTAQASRPTF